MLPAEAAALDLRTTRGFSRTSRFAGVRSVAVRTGIDSGTKPAAARLGLEGTVFPILAAVSFCHFLNDLVQSLLPAIYPILKQNFALDFGQVGLLTLTFQLTASLLQPVIGLYTDRTPLPYSLPLGMGATLLGLPAALGRADLRLPAHGRGLDRARIVGLPP